MKIEFLLNGKPISQDISPEKKLLHFLRDDMLMTGTKCGCDNGDCGVCSVLLDGKLVKSCLLPVSEVNGRKVTTIEGIHDEVDGPNDLQQSMLNHGAIQCGFCTPAMVMAGEALLLRNPSPNREEIRAGINSVLCRCTGYQQIIDAIEETAIKRQASLLKKEHDREGA